MPSEPLRPEGFQRFFFVCLFVCLFLTQESTNTVSARSTFGLGKLIFSDRYANLFSLQLFTTSYTNFPAVYRQATVARAPGGKGWGERAVRGSGG